METILYDGQPYERVGERPYQRKDGLIVQLVGWRSRCADCGEPFEFWLSDHSPFQPNRRCSRCKRPAHRVKGKHRKTKVIRLIDGVRVEEPEAA